MNILDLPDTVLMDIFEYLSYDEVAKKREVCARFDHIGQDVLNKGFNKIIMEHGRSFKLIKSMLPRRESERRNHFLARHSDILTSIDTRISMLTMTYSKYIDLNICCFIPGRVLDEISNILKRLAITSNVNTPQAKVKTNNNLRPHEVLQELRDISSMAIEHFDEKIAINFKTEHRSKLAEAGTRVVVCGSLADISFSGVKRNVNTAPGSSSNKCLNDVPLYNNLFFNKPCMKPNPLAPQAKQLSANPQDWPKHSRERLLKHIKKQSKIQKYLLLKVRTLEIARGAQDRQLQDALGTITELGTRVSELKRQLEDVVTNKRNSSNSTSTAIANCSRRHSFNDDCCTPIKKMKA